MKQDEKAKESVLKENAAQDALTDALLKEKDTEEVNGGYYPYPMPKVPPQEIP